MLLLILALETVWQFKLKTRILLYMYTVYNNLFNIWVAGGSDQQTKNVKTNKNELCDCT